MFDCFYWTDSLCLNQKDAQEIGEQVPRMGEIYTLAEDVLIWLGHEKQGEDAMKLVRDWSGPVDWGLVDINNEEEVERANGVENMRHSVGEAAVFLLLLPYWSRVWIVQEVALARKACVAYGNISLDIDDFRLRVDLFRRGKSEFAYQPTVWSLCDLRQARAKKPLWELTTEFNLSSSTKTIDKVYGFLGLVEDPDNGISPAKLIEVDKDKMPFEVFWDTLFECRAPWNKCSSVMLSLGQLLWEQSEIRPNWDFRVWEQYACEVRTSGRHARFANHALCVFDAANVIRMLIGAEFQEWSKAIDDILSSTMQTRGEFTELQNAAAIGLALAAARSEMYSIWKNYQTQRVFHEVSASFQWSCASHQAEEGNLGLAVNSNLQECPKAWIRSDQNVLQGGCSKHSPSCSGSVITFGIQNIDFRVIFLSDVGAKVAGGTICLDVRVNNCYSGSRLRGQEVLDFLILALLLFLFLFLGSAMN